MESINLVNANKIAKAQRNLGIEILRMFLCFRIIILHYYSGKTKYILRLKNSRTQVSCFFFISFYFLYPTISKRNIQKIKLRLERLIIPFIIYPIVVWIMNNLMFLVIKYNRFNRLLTLNELILNLITGKGIFGIGILWFHFNLIIFSIFFFLASFLLENNFLIVFQILSSFSYIIQYEKINYRFFRGYTVNIWMSVGNLIETFPIALAGFSLASSNILKTFLNNRKKCLFFFSFFRYLIMNYDVFSNLSGNSSPGIIKIAYSFFLFNIFCLLPFEILNDKILCFITQITKFTQGIYCLHFLILYYLKVFFNKKGSFCDCIMLYIIAYLLSFIGFKIFSKTKLKYLFS
jgi:hypothetical protein